MKKILFANGRMLPPFTIGGDGVSLNTFLNRLSDNNFECLALGVSSNPESYYRVSEEEIFEKLKRLKIKFYPKTDFPNSKVRLRKFPPKLFLNKKIFYENKYSYIMVRREYFESELKRTIKAFRPNVILTQLDFCQKVLEIGKGFDTPTILFIHDAEKINLEYLKSANQFSCACVIFNSQFTKNYLKNHVKCPYFVCYPPIEIKDYLIKKNIHKFITMINPVKWKGGVILEQIAKRLPQRNFLAVVGWRHPNLEGINLERCSNIKLIERQDDMKRIYNKTNILLVPSIWREPFPRVVLEAGLNGIPTIASVRGGLRETVGGGGILIQDYKNSDVWARRIESIIKNRKLYKKLSLKARKNALRFDSKLAIKKVIKVINRVIEK